MGLPVQRRLQAVCGGIEAFWGRMQVGLLPIMAEDPLGPASATRDSSRCSTTRALSPPCVLLRRRTRLPLTHPRCRLAANPIRSRFPWDSSLPQLSRLRCVASALSAPTPAVAVAVVSWNTRELLSRCLHSLEPEARCGRAEVWVVDNASSDGSVQLVEENFRWAHVIASSENLGFGRAVNLVAQRTSTPWMAPANADIALESGALARLLRTGAEHPDAGAVAPRLILPDGSTQRSVYPFPTLAFTIVHNLGLPRIVPALADQLCQPPAWNPERQRAVDWAIGAFLLVRREAWDAVGGFDPAQWIYAEDLDLGWRLTKAGWPTRYEPRAHVQHHKSAATEQAWGEDSTGRWLAATYTWMVRRRGPVITRSVALVNVVGALVRWLLRIPLARLAPGRWSAGRDWFRQWTYLHAMGLRGQRRTTGVADTGTQDDQRGHDSR